MNILAWKEKFWIRFFCHDVCDELGNSKTTKNDKNRQGDDLAIVSLNKGKRSSPRDRLCCWWYFPLFWKLIFTLDSHFPPRIKKLKKKMYLHFLRLWACPNVDHFPREKASRARRRERLLYIMSSAGFCWGWCWFWWVCGVSKGENDGKLLIIFAHFRTFLVHFPSHPKTGIFYPSAGG